MLGKYSYVHETLVETRPLEMEVPRPKPLVANSVAKAAKAVEAAWLCFQTQGPAASRTMKSFPRQMAERRCFKLPFLQFLKKMGAFTSPCQSLPFAGNSFSLSEDISLFFFDYYKGNKTTEYRGKNTQSTEHCLEVILASGSCQSVP
jgi:hypothetical protein